MMRKPIRTYYQHAIDHDDEVTAVIPIETMEESVAHVKRQRLERAQTEPMMVVVG